MAEENLATKEEMVEEAAKRMRYLGVGLAVPSLHSGKVLTSEDYGMLYGTHEGILEKISKLEERTGYLIYHIIKGTYMVGTSMEDAEKMIMHSCLYVSARKSAWEDERRFLQEGLVYAYVYNETVPEFSEAGFVGVRSLNEGLVRDERNPEVHDFPFDPEEKWIDEKAEALDE